MCQSFRPSKVTKSFVCNQEVMGLNPNIVELTIKRWAFLSQIEKHWGMSETWNIFIYRVVLLVKPGRSTKLYLAEYMVGLQEHGLVHLNWPHQAYIGG